MVEECTSDRTAENIERRVLYDLKLSCVTADVSTHLRWTSLRMNPSRCLGFARSVSCKSTGYLSKHDLETLERGRQFL